MTKRLRLSDNNFKAAIIKNTSISNYKHFETKNKRPWQRNKRYKELNGNPRTEKNIVTGI